MVPLEPGVTEEREREGSLKIAGTPTIISFNINYSPEIWSDRLWAKNEKGPLWNKCEGEVWIMDFQSGRGERCISSAQEQNTFRLNDRADRIRVATFQVCLFPAELWRKVSDVQYIHYMFSSTMKACRPLGEGNSCTVSKQTKIEVREKYAICRCTKGT